MELAPSVRDAAGGPPALPVHWLEPLPLPGGHALPNRILPGPMEGVTTGSFCELLAARHLVRCWITPFVRITTDVPRASRLKARVADCTRTGLPVIVQLMGTDIGKLAGAAAAYAEFGAIGIDLNCACPSPVVVRHGAGGAQLRTPQWIRDALVALRAACPACGVSVKLRTGYASATELPAILAAVREARPDFVVVHFRTVAEGYTAVADGLARLARARKELPGLPLFGSGDLFTAAEALRMYAGAGVDGVVPARGLLANPWLLRDIEAACAGRPPAPPSEAAKIEFLDGLATAAERASGLHPSIRGFVVMLAGHLFGRDHPLFRQLAKTRRLAEARAALASRLPPRRSSP